MLLPLSPESLGFVSGLQLELGGAWTRGAMQASMPPPPLEASIRSAVLAQAIIAIDLELVEGASWVAHAPGVRPTPVGVIGIVEPNPRAGTAWFDIALTGLVTDGAEPPYSMSSVHSDISLFIEHAGRDWQLRRLYARVPATLVDLVGLGKHGFEPCGVLPGGCWRSGRFEDLALLSLKISDG